MRVRCPFTAQLDRNKSRIFGGMLHGTGRTKFRFARNNRWDKLLPSTW